MGIMWVRNPDKAQQEDSSVSCGLTRVPYEVTVRWWLVLEHAQCLCPYVVLSQGQLGMDITLYTRLYPTLSLVLLYGC